MSQIQAAHQLLKMSLCQGAFNSRSSKKKKKKKRRGSGYSKITAVTGANCISSSNIYELDFYQDEIELWPLVHTKQNATVWLKKHFTKSHHFITFWQAQDTVWEGGGKSTKFLETQQNNLSCLFFLEKLTLKQTKSGRLSGRLTEIFCIHQTIF